MTETRPTLLVVDDEIVNIGFHLCHQGAWQRCHQTRQDGPQIRAKMIGSGKIFPRSCKLTMRFERAFTDAAIRIEFAGFLKNKVIVLNT